MSETTVSRRSFLKATAVAGVAAAVGSSALTGLTAQAAADTADDEVQILKTLCRGCVGRCGVLAHVKNGRVIKLEGDPDQQDNQGKLCSKALAGIQALYNPNRIKYPMRRVGERGENKWERVSWDEAITEIAEQLIENGDKYGPETLMVGHGGGGHTYLGEPALRFLHVYGSPNIFEPGGMQCLEPRMNVSQLLVGGFDGDITECAWPELALTGQTACKALVVWGSNPAWSCAGRGERPLADARAAGLKTVVIDPRFTADASKADVWLPVRPQTDTALMLCWIKYIIENDLYNHEAVLRWTNLPYLVNLETNLCLRPEDLGEEPQDLAYVIWDAKSGSAKVMKYPYDEALEPALEPGVVTVNGIECKTAFELLHDRSAEWTLEKTAEVCWLEPDKIEEAVRIYAENSPSAISTGMAGDHCALSTQVGIGQVVLEALMGNFGNPGNLIQQYDYSGNPYSAFINTMNCFIEKDEFMKRPGASEYRMNASQWALNYGLQEMMLTGEPYQPRVYIERSGNKLINMPNAEKFAEAVSKLDYVVHMYMYPTSFTHYADLMLPCTEWLEVYWIAGCANRVHVMRPVTHLWDTLDEPAFWGLLAKKLASMGYGRFPLSDDVEAMKAMELPEGNLAAMPENPIPWWTTCEEMITLNCKANGSEWTWAELRDYVQENGYWEYKTPEEFLTFGAYLEPGDDGLPRGWGTASRKIEAFGDAIVRNGLTGAPFSTFEFDEPAPWAYDPMPYYREPEESPLNPEFADYPLVMTGGHIPRYHHGTLRNVAWMRERQPVPELWLNPVDAEQYGIADGDWVWVESKRGKTQAKALITMQVSPGVTYMERFWFPETLNTPTQGWREMNVNLLTNDSGPFNDMIGTATYRGFCVKVTKADSAPEGIWLEPKQFEPWLASYSEPEVTDLNEIAGGVIVG